MYNLNVNVTTAASSLAVESSCTTPKTPEILNSLMAMSNPFDNCYASGGGNSLHVPGGAHQLGMSGGGGPRTASSPPEGMCGAQEQGTFLHPGMTCMPPPSVQHTCSQLIKEGLKLTIQSKRKLSGGSDPGVGAGGGGLTPMDSPHQSFCKIPRLQFTPPGGGGSIGSSGDEDLTVEDEERRRRRRERNKIAATKCRLKKRERTVNLVQESEVLETQNHELKTQIQDLEAQRRRLMDMLTVHSQTCIKNVQPGVSLQATGPPQQQQHYHPPHPQHHPQSQSQQQQQGYMDPYQLQYTGPNSCSPVQEQSPSPPGTVYSDMGGGYAPQQQQQPHGMDSGCLA